MAGNRPEIVPKNVVNKITAAISQRGKWPKSVTGKLPKLAPWLRIIALAIWPRPKEITIDIFQNSDRRTKVVEGGRDERETTSQIPQACSFK